MGGELEPFYQSILEKLGIASDAQIERKYSIPVGDRKLRIDLAIKSGDTLTLVEIKSRINEDTIYRIYTLSHLINEQSMNGRRLKLVCAGKSLKYSTQELSARLGVEILLIPPKLYHYLAPMTTVSGAGVPFEHLKASPSRLTSEKAWKIVSNRTLFSCAYSL